MTQENLTPEKEQRIIEKQIDSSMSKEQAQQEVAKEDVEGKTGQSFEKTRRLAIDVMEVNEGLERQDAGTTAREMADIDSKEVQEMNDKMAQGNLAEEIVQAGLGPQFLSTGASGLERSSKNVAEKSQLYGDRKQMEQMIDDVSKKSPEISREQAEKMSPDELKKVSQEPETTSQTEKATETDESENKNENSEITKGAEDVSQHLEEVLKQGSNEGKVKAAENLNQILTEDQQKGQQKNQQNAFKTRQQNVVE